MIKNLRIVFLGLGSLTALNLLAIAFNAPPLFFQRQGNLSWVLLIYGINSLFTFIFYANDKRVALSNGAGKSHSGGTRQNMRVPEILLHFSELLGGWPGGLLARSVLHHKTNWKTKLKFKTINWLIILVHLSFWAWYFFLK